MATRTLTDDALALSVPDRLALMERLWQSLQHEIESAPLSDDERAELDARVEDMERKPADQSPWDEVEARLRRRK